jgi:glycosyltransferase involved in cell wall biosynthesis
MKILHLLSQRPDSTGSGVYVQAIMAQASRRGHTNALVAGIPRDYCFPDPVQDLCADQVLPLCFEKELDFPVAGMSDVMPYDSIRFCDLEEDQITRYEACFSRVVEQAVKQWSPDVIHANHLWLLTALAGRMVPDIPVVASCHGSDLRQFRQCGHLRERVVSGCSRLAGVFALTREQKTTIAELYGLESGRITVTGAGYDETLFTPRSKSLSLSPLHLVFAGKLSRAKGVPWLVRACRMLEGDFVLHLAGSGSGREEREIREMASGLEDKVVMHGSLTQVALADLLRRSHIFVLPSFFEGLPLVLLEALASGCSLVATGLPGVDELFGNLNPGIVGRVPLPRMCSVDIPHPDDEDDYARSLAGALREQMDRIRSGFDVRSEPVVKELLARFTWSGVYERIDAVYQRLV